MSRRGKRRRVDGVGVGRGPRRSVAKFNAIAEEVAEDVGAAYVDVFKYYGPDDIKENTKDGKHASAENYVKWTMDVLQAIDDQLDTGCIAVEPTRKPTST